MSKPPIPPKLAKGYRKNFETIKRAMANGDLCIMSAIEKATNEPRALLCAMGRDEQGNCVPSPLAILCWQNPFEQFYDPTV